MSLPSQGPQLPVTLSTSGLRPWSQQPVPETPLLSDPLKMLMPTRASICVSTHAYTSYWLFLCRTLPH